MSTSNSVDILWYESTRMLSCNNHVIWYTSSRVHLTFDEASSTLYLWSSVGLLWGQWMKSWPLTLSVYVHCAAFSAVSFKIIIFFSYYHLISHLGLRVNMSFNSFCCFFFPVLLHTQKKGYQTSTPGVLLLQIVPFFLLLRVSISQNPEQKVARTWRGESILEMNPWWNSNIKGTILWTVK